MKDNNTFLFMWKEDMQKNMFISRVFQYENRNNVLVNRRHFIWNLCIPCFSQHGSCDALYCFHVSIHSYFVSAMHRQFQHDLYRLRLETARSYVKCLENSITPISSNPQEPLKLAAAVCLLTPIKILQHQNCQNIKLSVRKFLRYYFTLYLWSALWFLCPCCLEYIMTQFEEQRRLTLPMSSSKAIDIFHM